MRCDTDRVSFDPYAPYGPVVRVVRSGSSRGTSGAATGLGGRPGRPPWRTPSPTVEPDVVCLVEAWRWGESSQPERVARRLGLPYCHFAGDWQQEDWVSGIGPGLPVADERAAASARCDRKTARVSGKSFTSSWMASAGRSSCSRWCSTTRSTAAAIRQAQVRQLASFVSEIAPKRDLVIVCGDFNAGPDSDEIRMLTGRSRLRESRAGVLRQLGDRGRRLTRLHLVQPQSPGRDRPCTPTGASTTSSPPGRGAMVPDTRSAARCSASARPTRTRYPTTTGWSRSFATELGSRWSGQARCR